MLRRPRIVPTTIVALLAVFGSRAAAQTVQRSIVVLPPVEIGANVSFTERFDTPPGQHDWTGPGLSLVANANLTHWEVGYRIVPSARMRQAAGYAEIGFIVGPRLR